MPVGWAIVVVVLAVAVAVLAVIVLGLLRQVTPVLERAATATQAGMEVTSQGPVIGEPLPRFSAGGPNGEVTDEQLRGQPALLLFLSVGCGPCEMLTEDMRKAGLNGLDKQLIVVTSPGGQRELDLPADVRVLTEQNRSVSEALSVIGTPFAIAVDPEGIVKGVSVPNTVRQLGDLAAQHHHAE